jgi:hypothetical protein
VIVTTIADTGFVEMRLGKVVGITTEEGDADAPRLGAARLSWRRPSPTTVPTA